MATLTQQPTVTVEGTLTLSEPEMRALEAITGYSENDFLAHFYKNMGKAYLQPHEAGFRSFWKSIREPLQLILGRANDARKAFGPSSNPKPELPPLGRNVAEHLQSRAIRAERALIRAGFKDNGGEDWKPPIGRKPVLHERVRAIADKWKGLSAGDAMNPEYDLADYIAGAIAEALREERGEPMQYGDNAKEP